MTTANDIRTTFLEYFRRQGHEVVAASPLVPRNDPTLMFTNSGMVQFKNVFTGQDPRPYKRATTAQKCVRAGGKHNDLENVGYTARHHTFFEMLGNFSFGDYFKDDAIRFAWELITKDYGLKKDRLLVTVYSEDDQAAAIWKKVAGFGDDKIIRIATTDNFWSMGDTGPCGPCSEIFWDHGDKIPGGPPGSPDADGDRFIEIWNLVFMQFEQVTKEKRVNLPKPSIDTGMGLERIAAVLQGKHDNYDVDTMRAIILAVAEATGVDPDGPQRVSHRVIGDHLRASVFLIADGVLPSNEGRGYVLRRIMRRGMRHAEMLGAKEPLLWKLVPTLVAQMGGHYTELQRVQALATETLRLEEGRFKTTLARGLKLLGEETAKLKPGQPLSGQVAFALYDTYGFPLDLTADVLRGQKRAVDEAAFNAAMAAQRAKARAAWAGSGEKATEIVWFDVKEKAGASEFLGYATEAAAGQVAALLKDGKPVEKLAQGEDGILVLNQTPFYAESGGQMGDAGEIRTLGGRFVVSDTQKKLGEIHAHVGRVAEGEVKLGAAADAIVDGERRAQLRANHSATHLLHEALRRRLGDHVSQKGSLVAPDRLRFDISHPKPVAPEEIKAVEAEVNQRVRVNEEVTTRFMTPDEAIKAGALALFGEKYGDEVRVVSMGGPKDLGSGQGTFSTELCGGTHVRRTGDIGLFKIVGEGAVSAGVRRIEALTGAAALAYVGQQEALVEQAASVLKAPAAELPERVTALLDDRRKLEREIAELRKRLAVGGMGGGMGGGDEVRTVRGVKYAARRLDGVPAGELKGMVDELKKKLGSGVVALVAVEEGKASLVVGVTADLAAKLSAVDLVRVGSAALGGKGGGGRPEMAQAGGPDVGQADAALAAIAGDIEKRAA